MVDVGEKAVTLREALARGAVKMEPATLEAIVGGRLKKGEALAAARLAGIMAASPLICRPVILHRVHPSGRTTRLPPKRVSRKLNQSRIQSVLTSGDCCSGPSRAGTYNENFRALT